ncbi:MAG: hypothetical protein OEW35_12130 [Gammaproteobacteria bacterium]|nr:hypothetical protein [Gammaproteobacteria bacterium]
MILAIGLPPALIFAWAYEMTPEGLKREKDVDRSRSITSQTGRKLDRIIISVLSVAVVLLLIDKFMLSPAIPPDTAETSDKSIAVLPFVNMSSDPEQEFFSDGITEEILNSLAAVKELKVAGRTSSFAFKGRNEDLRLIGDTLGVAHILEGSVRKAGATVRITAQLIQVDDGFHLWSETYDRQLNDVFAIQDEIATEILKQLKARLLDEEIAILTAERTDPEVYDLYLLAKQRIYSRTRETIESAAELLDRAIARDPLYAPALAQRGIVSLLLSEDSYGATPDEIAEADAKAYLDRALDLDPQSAEAWGGLGLYHQNRPYEHEQAIDALTRALSINPSYMDASNWLYVVLGATGDVRGTLELTRDMMTRDPLYRPGFANGVNTLNNFGLRDEAQAAIDRFRRFEPGDPQVARVEAMHYLYAGEPARALPLAEAAYAAQPSNVVNQFALTVALFGTMQVERVLEFGTDIFRVDAADYLGQPALAIEIAQEVARSGYVEPLLQHLNRQKQSRDAVAWVEERWSDLESFAADHPADDSGWDTMGQLAYAYRESGNRARFEQAVDLYGVAQQRIADAGIDNWVQQLDRARYFVLAGDPDSALAALDRAIALGYRGWLPIAGFEPAFAELVGDPRYDEIEARLVDVTNAERDKLGLDPIDVSGAFPP